MRKERLALSVVLPARDFFDFLVSTGRRSAITQLEKNRLMPPESLEKNRHHRLTSLAALHNELAAR